ncbi:Cyb5p KNAG_0I02040 [Huiozyma naganishii CBS 8797]|uniref:Cytochrome b5 heme-binding domain-containing protein n=1 Tax=Huiozyma naganishii (strain ATCC MYA-139 / BCRC 22969 / CBS 8797 / KCTC 17520 / NBRC 10181 / NCYC 3082 / Yp74L-3) TaxID=1071383 RepID=J7S9B3_HUIN7|nr:hypothetical protein KNAG_0I02040 [Kazachstania naganishii CBS 8797]CCK71989.1 hypothetical protein KNAG_0I02040 [Kazachstania naganishii CBS 8797]
MAKIYTYEDVAQHSTSEDAWIVIDNRVYEVTKFLDEHPGGEEILLEMAGADATTNFLDIGHSDDAMKILKTRYIGDIDPSSKPIPKKVVETTSSETKGSGKLASVIALICFVIGYYLLN